MVALLFLHSKMPLAQLKKLSLPSLPITLIFPLTSFDTIAAWFFKTVKLPFIPGS